MDMIDCSNISIETGLLFEGKIETVEWKNTKFIFTQHHDYASLKVLFTGFLKNDLFNRFDI